MSLHLKPVWDFLFLAVENILTNRCRQLKLIRESCPVMSDSLRPLGLFSPWNSPGQNTRVGNLSFLQGIFPTHGSKSDLPHCRWILYQLSHQGSPRILEWVTYSFSSRSSQPRNQIWVSCIAGRFFTSWATRKAVATIQVSLTNSYEWNRYPLN